jgi:Linear amide C-N hydrolases, choloylglycine hydrolase family
MSRLRMALATLVVLAQAVACPSLVWACTGITIKPKDGSIIFARTLEFAVDLKSNIIVVPRGKENVGTAPGDKPGLRWKRPSATCRRSTLVEKRSRGSVKAAECLAFPETSPHRHVSFGR